MREFLPFSRPSMGDEELTAIQDVLRQVGLQQVPKTNS
jgi:UDP-4-amino-4-deoxy-L-arabinose-oxoglutarate aminotransferase